MDPSCQDDWEYQRNWVSVVQLQARFSRLSPFQAVAEAVNSAQSLHKLKVIIRGETFPIDPSGPTELANALREHAALQEFMWLNFGSRREAAPRNLSLDPLLQALPACPHLEKVTIWTKCASAEAMQNLLQLQSATSLHLVMKTDQWLSVADEIRRGRCNVQRLTLTLDMLQVTISDATEAVKAVASAIRLDRNLKHLKLQMENGFTDEAGVASAEALTVNKTLCKIILSDDSVFDEVHNKATLGAQAYEAFSAMLRVNTSLDLELSPNKTAGADERLRESHNQMHIEMRLNKVGRGRLLASVQTTREEWVDTLHELNSYNADIFPRYQISCACTA
jgi:hypothetical protein